LRPSEVTSLPGVPIATAYEERLPAATVVAFAIYGIALDLSELEGLPGGSVLFLDGARTYQVAKTGPSAALPARCGSPCTSDRRSPTQTQEPRLAQ
jgi:hypothetical protein